MNLDSIFYISCFLPVTLALYWLMPGIKAKNWLLLLVSLLFYAFGSLTTLPILVVCCLVNYLLGLWLRREKASSLPLILGVVFNIAVLCAYKYLDFFLRQVLGIEGITLSWAVPIGISFFTFKSISYLVDVHRNKDLATKNFSHLLLYISFFPQVVMGPITRFPDFLPQLHHRTHSLDATVSGLKRFVMGLAKKLVISGVLAALVNEVFKLDTGILDARLAWLGAIGYCLQLYFDFSGYIDMAIGLGWIFGFQTTENFNYPYIAPTITDFWRRWHISLSAWFKDYVYIPLGGNRKGSLRTGLHKAIVFLLCGFWHGASWTFLIWGLWHGLFSLLESTNVIPAKKLQNSKVLGHVYTLLVVCLGFVMFRAGTVSQGFTMIATMFTGFSFTDAGTVALYRILTPEAMIMLLAGIGLSMPVLPKLQQCKPLQKFWDILSFAGTILLFVFCIIRLASGDFVPSIYAGF